jgi:guanosine-3',5'-bis(diphosphate) 3'-pyrophosphohydrolase
MKDITHKALEFATVAHAGQKRKYTGEDYIVHPIEVMEIIKTVSHTPEMLAAALLHDVVEDTNVSLEDIRLSFGNDVADLVFWLTDVSKLEDGNRATRKSLDRAHIANASPDAMTIKLADLISNTASIMEYDANFAKVYLKESPTLRLLFSHYPLYTTENPASDPQVTHDTPVCNLKLFSPRSSEQAHQGMNIHPFRYR